MIIVMFGPPGVGKGTYTKRLQEKYQLPHISTGDLFRDNMKNHTALGRQVEDMMKTGQLIPDDITTQMLKERISQKDCSKGYFLDGYPRTIPQAESLESFASIDKVLNFTADESNLVMRISGRRVCKDCGFQHHIITVPSRKEGICDKCGGTLYQRPDDNESVVRERLREYDKKTRPLIEHYRQKGLLIEVDANARIDDPNCRIIDDCIQILDPIYKSIRKNTQSKNK